jgi:primosomal protein N'
MSIRKKLNYSPYYFLVSVKIISKDYELAKKESTLIAEKLKTNLTNSIILGPSIGSTFKVNNTYRFGITIKYKKEDKLYPYLKELLSFYSSNSKLVIDIDFNPIM